MKNLDHIVKIKIFKNKPLWNKQKIAVSSLKYSEITFINFKTI
jgi:hypothetical protein